MFLYRRGDGAFYDLERSWRETHSDEHIRRMKSLGINLCHIHFHKGYGLEHEQESIREAAEFASRLHRAGIRVGVYIGSTFFTEAFRHPKSDEMIMQNGSASWSGAQYFRKGWCWNSPHSRKYFCEVIRVAIQEVQADVLHFDQAWASIFHQSCHCPYCVEGFHRSIREKNPEIMEIAGYARSDVISPPPLAINGDYLASVRELVEPGAIAWLMYHAEAGAEALRFFSDYARKLKPDINILFNGAALCGIPPFARAEHVFDKLPLAEICFVEDSLENPPGVTAGGMPVARFRAYKAGLRAKCRMVYYTAEQGHRTSLMLAEAAAFNYASLGCLSMVQQDKCAITEDADEKLLSWLVARDDLFLDRTPWHHVAVLRHHESELLNPFPCSLTPYVVEQMLFEKHVPFTIIHKRDLVAAALQKEFDLVILPDSKCLDEAELRELEHFVENGGRILSIGMTAAATRLNQFRPTWGLERIFKHPAKPMMAHTEQEVVAGTLTKSALADAHSAEPIKADYGDGRAIHIPALQFNLPRKEDVHSWAGYDWYYHPFWKAPHNAAVFWKAFDDLLDKSWRIRTDLPSQAGMECFEIRNGFRFYFVNYRTEKIGAARLQVRFGKPVKPIETVTWETPEGEINLRWKFRSGALEIHLPEFELLGILTLK
jgi:hypothetical protein